MRKKLLRQIMLPLIGPFLPLTKPDRLHGTDISRVTDTLPKNYLIIAHDQFMYLKHYDGLRHYAFDKKIMLYN